MVGMYINITGKEVEADVKIDGIISELHNYLALLLFLEFFFCSFSVFFFVIYLFRKVIKIVR